MKKKFFAVALATTMALSTAMTAFAVDVKDTISGDLTVTTFFNERTDAVALKSGDSYTFKFKNTSTEAAKNWENYVLAITGEIGDAYTGADQEVLIIRADAWGWGGGMSDFVAPDAASGNKLEFTSDANFETWKDEVKAGVDCEVTIARTGDKLDYTAKIGNYTISTSATSGKALPETCYAFFTGEKCSLTGISTTKAGGSSTPEPDSKPSTDPIKAPDGNPATTPKTGDVAPVAALAAVAVVACAAVVVSKKKVTE